MTNVGEMDAGAFAKMMGEAYSQAEYGDWCKVEGPLEKVKGLQDALGEWKELKKIKEVEGRLWDNFEQIGELGINRMIDMTPAGKVVITSPNGPFGWIGRYAALGVKAFEDIAFGEPKKILKADHIIQQAREQYQAMDYETFVKYNTEKALTRANLYNTILQVADQVELGEEVKKKLNYSMKKDVSDVLKVLYQNEKETKIEEEPNEIEKHLGYAIHGDIGNNTEDFTQMNIDSPLYLNIESE